MDEENTRGRSGKSTAPGTRWKGFDEIPIRLDVVIGQAAINAREWLEGGIGTRMVLESRWKDGVTLKVNGKIVGTGEVVLIRNRLGVRVTRWEMVR